MLVPLGINLSGGEIESTNAALNAPPDKTRQLPLASTSLKRSTGALHAYGTGCRACHAGNHGFDPRTLRHVSTITPSPDGPERAALARGGAVRSARLAHTQEVTGSNPVCATTHRDLTGSREFGPLAHLGERLPCKQEVIGSSPIRSTSFGREADEAPVWPGAVSGLRRVGLEAAIP